MDIAVLPEPPFSYPELYADLSLALETDRLEVVDLRLAPPYLVADILAGRCILERSPLERARFEAGKRAQWRELAQRTRRPPKEPRGPAANAAREGRMTLRPEFLAHALAELERIAQELEKYRETTEAQLTTNLSLRWTIERGLLAGLSVVFHVADPILSQAYGRTATSYEALLSELQAAGVISAELYGRLRGSGGFRNVLVHEYVTIDLGQVLAALRSAPQRLRLFRQEIEAWMQRQARP